MKILVQWYSASPKDWDEIDSREWPRLPSSKIAAVNIQGVVFSGRDHYALETLGDGSVRIASWDEGDLISKVDVWTFPHLAPDARLGGAVNTVQSLILPPAEFSLESLATLEGRPLDDLENQRHQDSRDLQGWRSWTEGVPVVHLTGNHTRVAPQRALGFYPKAKGTQTYYASNTAHPLGAYTFEASTGTAASLGYSFSANESAQILFWYTNYGEINNYTWPAGTYRIQFDCTSVGASVRYGLCAVGTTNGYFGRYSGEDSSPIGWAQQSESYFTGTGLKLATTTTALNASGKRLDDYWGVELAGFNNSGSAASITLEVNESDDYTDGPWTTTAFTGWPQHQQAYTAAKDTEDAGTWRETQTIDMPSSTPAGVYRIGWSCAVSSNSYYTDVWLRVQVDNTTTVAHSRITTAEYSRSQDGIITGFAYVELSAAAHYIDLDFYSTDPIYEAYVSQRQLDVWRVDTIGKAIALLQVYLDVSDTNTTPWKETQTIDMPPSTEAGRYRIGWSYEWGSTTAEPSIYDFIARVQVDNTTTLMSQDQIAPYYYSGGTTDYQTGGFAYTDLAAGAHSIDLDFYSTAGTAKIVQRRLEVWLVDDIETARALQDAYTAAADSTTGTSWKETQTIDMPSGTVAGIYRVGWSYRWSCSNTTVDFKAQVQVDDTTTLISHTEEAFEASTTPNCPTGGFGYVTLTAGAHYIDLDFTCSSASYTAYIADRQLEVCLISAYKTTGSEMEGEAALSSSPGYTFLRSCEMLAEAYPSGAPAFSFLSTGELEAEADLIGAADRILGGWGALTAEADLVGAADRLLGGLGALTAEALLTGLGGYLLSGAGALEAEADLEGELSILWGGAGALLAEADLIGAATRLLGGFGALTAEAALVGNNTFLFGGAGALSSEADLVGAAALLWAGAGALSAEANLHGMPLIDLKWPNFQQAYDAAMDSNYGVVWKETLTINMPADTVAGRYRIGWSYGWGANSISYSFQARVQVDDTTTVATHIQAPNETANQVQTADGFGYVTLTAGAHFVDLDFCASYATTSTYIYGRRLELWRVDTITDGLELQEAYTAAQTSVTGIGVWNWVQTINMPSDTPEGTYRIGFSGAYAQNTASYDMLIRVYVDRGTAGAQLVVEGIQRAHLGSSAQRQQVSSFGYVELTQGAHTIDLGIQSSTAGYSAYMADRRLEVWLADPLINELRLQQVRTEAQDYQYGTSWKETQTLDLPADTPAGVYRIGWSYEWTGSSASYDFKARVQLDNDITWLAQHDQEPHVGSSTFRQPTGGFVYVSLAAGAHYIDIDIANEYASGYSYVTNRRIEVWQVLTLLPAFGALVGEADLSGAAALLFQRSCELLGEAYLSGNPAFSFLSSGALEAEADLVGAANRLLGGRGELTAEADLVGGATLLLAALGALTGEADLDGNSVLFLGAVGALEAEADLAGIASRLLGGRGELTAEADFAGGANLLLSALGALTGEADLVGLAKLLLSALGALTGEADLVGLANLLCQRSLTLEGEAYLSGDPAFSFLAAGALLGEALLEGAATKLIGAGGVLSGEADLDGHSALLLAGAGELEAEADLGGLANLQCVRSLNLYGEAYLSGDPAFTFCAEGSVEGEADLVGFGVNYLGGLGSLEGEALLEGAAIATYAAAGEFYAEAILEGLGGLFFPRSLDLYGEAYLSGSPAFSFLSAGSLEGEADVEGSPTAIYAGAGQLTGEANIEGIPTMLWAAEGILECEAYLSGFAGLSISRSLDLYGEAYLSGSPAFSFLATGELEAEADLDGAAILTYAGEGDLTGESDLEGLGGLRFSVAGMLEASADLQGIPTCLWAGVGGLTAEADVDANAVLWLGAEGHLQAEADILGVTLFPGLVAEYLAASLFAACVASFPTLGIIYRGNIHYATPPVPQHRPLEEILRCWAQGLVSGISGSIDGAAAGSATWTEDGTVTTNPFPAQFADLSGTIADGIAAVKAELAWTGRDSDPFLTAIITALFTFFDSAVALDFGPGPHTLGFSQATLTATVSPTSLQNGLVAAMTATQTFLLSSGYFYYYDKPELGLRQELIDWLTAMTQALIVLFDSFSVGSIDVPPNPLGEACAPTPVSANFSLI